jgi:hypothetical protein
MLKLAERKKLSFPRSYLLAALKNSLLQAAWKELKKVRSEEYVLISSDIQSFQKTFDFDVKM